MSNFVSYSDATSLFTKVGQRINALNGAYIFKGSVAFANLPSPLTAAMTGNVYNVTDEFTTTSDFIEGAGKKYPAGTNVAVANVGTAQSPSMKFDVVGAFYDFDELEAAIQAVSDMITGEFDDTSAYAIGDVVVYQGALYKFKAAHTANDPWDATEVDNVTVVDLIEAAEPASLTTEQLNTLLGLLD